MKEAYLNMTTGETTELDMKKVNEWLDRGDEVFLYRSREEYDYFEKVGEVKRVEYPRKVGTKGVQR